MEKFLTTMNASGRMRAALGGVKVHLMINASDGAFTYFVGLIGVFGTGCN